MGMELYPSPQEETINKKQRLIKWLCLPSDQDMGGPGRGMRVPPTMTELAIEIGVNRNTLYEWQRDPEFIEAKHKYKKQTTLELDDDYLHQISLAMLKKDPNDRIVQVYWRYIHPILEDEKLMGKWDHPYLTNNSTGDNTRLAQARAVAMVRELAPQYREMFLDILEQAFEDASNSASNSVGSYSPRKVYTGESEPAPELPALPAPSVDTTQDRPRYDPGRGIRKPYRKPKA